MTEGDVSGHNFKLSAMAMSVLLGLRNPPSRCTPSSPIATGSKKLQTSWSALMTQGGLPRWRTLYDARWSCGRCSRSGHSPLALGLFPSWRERLANLLLTLPTGMDFRPRDCLCAGDTSTEEIETGV